MTVHSPWFAGLRVLGPAEEWYCRCPALGLRPATVTRCLTCEAYAPWVEPPIEYDARYHIPRSQVWEGSRGRQSGCVHLHVVAPFDLGRIHRKPGQSLCGKSGWSERPAEGERLCPRCEVIRDRAANSHPREGDDRE